MMYIESKKSVVFLLLILTYKQSLNELQQPDLLVSLEPTTYSPLLQIKPWVVITNKQWFFPMIDL